MYTIVNVYIQHRFYDSLYLSNVVAISFNIINSKCTSRWFYPNIIYMFRIFSTQVSNTYFTYYKSTFIIDIMVLAKKCLKPIWCLCVLYMSSSVLFSHRLVLASIALKTIRNFPPGKWSWWLASSFCLNRHTTITI